MPELNTVSWFIESPPPAKRKAEGKKETPPAKKAKSDGEGESERRPPPLSFQCFVMMITRDLILMCDVTFFTI